MSKRKQSELIESSSSLEAERTLYEHALREAGLKKLRETVQAKRQKRKVKKGPNYFRNKFLLGLSANHITLSGNRNLSVPYNSMNINKLAILFKKMQNVPKLTDIINSINSFCPQSLQEKIVKNMYLFILDLHADRPWVFSKQFIDTYSEADYQYKFWSYLFELFLGRHPDIVLRWGDTISDSCKKAGKKFKLDLRLIMLNDEKMVDGCTGEVARKATVKKKFTDKLKSTIASKCHFNTFLKTMPFIRPKDIPLIKMPIIQIAGFNGKLSILSLPRKKEYQLEDVYSFCFPKSLHQIKSGSLEDLINFLSTVDNMMNNLRKLYHDNCTNDEDAIEAILTGSSQKKRLDLDAWITEPAFDDDEEEDEGEEEEEEEDEEEEEEEDEEEEDEEEEGDEDEE